MSEGVPCAQGGQWPWQRQQCCSCWRCWRRRGSNCASHRRWTMGEQAARVHKAATRASDLLDVLLLCRSALCCARLPSGALFALPQRLLTVLPRSAHACRVQRHPLCAHCDAQSRFGANTPHLQSIGTCELCVGDSAMRRQACKSARGRGHRMLDGGTVSQQPCTRKQN